MGYYGAGDYYGAGGLGSIFGGVARAVGGFLTGGVPGAIGAVTRSAPRGPSLPVIPTPGARGLGQRIVPGGATGFEVAGAPRRKRRRMQYTNQKALRRANKRVDGFVREVKKSLKHTPYRLVKGPRTPRRDLGPGHSHVK